MHLLTVFLCFVAALEHRDVSSKSAHSARKEPKGSDEEGWTESLQQGLAPTSFMEQQAKVAIRDPFMVGSFKIGQTNAFSDPGMEGKYSLFPVVTYAMAEATAIAKPVQSGALLEYRFPKWLVGVHDSKFVYGLDKDYDATLEWGEVMYEGVFQQKAKGGLKIGGKEGAFDIDENTPCGAMKCVSRATAPNGEGVKGWYVLGEKQFTAEAAIETLQFISVSNLYAALPGWLVNKAKFDGKQAFVYGIDSDWNQKLDHNEILLQGISEGA